MSRSHHHFEVTEESDLGVPLVRVEGEVDLVSARELEGKVRQALRSEAGGLVLDLRQVTYLDALGIQALLNAGRLAKRQGKRLVLVDRVRPMRRELAACMVHRLVMIFPTIEHAREAFTAP
jgi:anti-sigma B factor antagonist